MLQKAKKKMEDGNSLYSRKMILPLGVSSNLPTNRVRKVSPFLIDLEIRKPPLPTQPLNLILSFLKVCESGKSLSSVTRNKYVNTSSFERELTSVSV
jgi:hypothetical protein